MFTRFILVISFTLFSLSVSTLHIRNCVVINSSRCLLPVYFLRPYVKEALTLWDFFICPLSRWLKGGDWLSPDEISAFKNTFTYTLHTYTFTLTTDWKIFVNVLNYWKSSGDLLKLLTSLHVAKRPNHYQDYIRNIFIYQSEQNIITKQYCNVTLWNYLNIIINIIINNTHTVWIIQRYQTWVSADIRSIWSHIRICTIVLCAFTASRRY